jgi:hypothetical protein
LIKPKKEIGYTSTLVTSAAMMLNGWTRMAIDQLLGAPDELRPNPNDRREPPIGLYRVERVLEVQNSDVFRNRTENTKSRDRHIRALRTGRTLRAKNIRMRHHDAWRHALMAVGLNQFFNFGGPDPNGNGACDWRSFLAKNLYENGWCFECVEHYRGLPELKCVACKGTGGFDACNPGPCRRCNGTRFQWVVFVCFRFDFDGKVYTWHQPAESVGFEYKTRAASSEFHLHEHDEKLLTFAAAKLVAARSSAIAGPGLSAKEVLPSAKSAPTIPPSSRTNSVGVQAAGRPAVGTR